VTQFGVGTGFESVWEKRYSIQEYAGYRFPVDRELLEKVDPKCLFIVIIMKLSLPVDAVTFFSSGNREQLSLPPKPGKQRAVTFTSSEAGSSTSKRQIVTSDDENRSEDDGVEDITNHKLQSKGINSVKRQKTKTSDGEKASAAGKKKTQKKWEKRERREKKRRKRRKLMRMMKKREKRGRGEKKRRMRTMKKRRKRKKRRFSNPQPHVAQ
jgi:hypothetical protein